MNNKILCILSIVLLFSCSEGNNEKKVEKVDSKVKNLNVSILLDLSDRIDTVLYANETMHFYKRDLGYIRSIARSFSSHLKTKRAFFIQDDIRVFIDPEPKSKKVNDVLQSLSFEFKRDTDGIIEKLDSLENNYVELSSHLYNQALEDNVYPGSDIWNFFKKKVSDFCIKEDKDNVVIIITDGYMFHEDSKYDESNRSSYLTSKNINAKGLNVSTYKDIIEEKDFGFIATREDLKDLRVLVLGVNPSSSYSNPYEGDVIETYWENWLHEMGVQDAKIAEAYLPSEAEMIINNFLLGER